MSTTPFAEFHRECKVSLEKALKKLYPKAPIPSIMLVTPPNAEFGELSSSICFELAKQIKAKPFEVAERVKDAIDVSKLSLVDSVKVAGGGYVNFYADFAKFAVLTISSVRKLGGEYGCVKTDDPKKIIVEHTSVNPIHPIHIGQARNPVLGDTLARLLAAQGHKVSRHYYIDDVGRQTAVIAYGYKKLGKPRPEGKPDHFIGAVYAVTSCIMEIKRLKGEIQKAEKTSREEFSKLQAELADWTSVATDLEGRFPKLFNQLLREIDKDEDSELKVENMIRGYEAGEKGAKQLLREVCQLCLRGFRETLKRAGIVFDSWDWESDFVWNGDVARVLKALMGTPYVFQAGEVLEFDAEKVAGNLGLKETFGLREDYAVPSLTLVRANGTTLYTTRDIAYSLWKFQNAEQVINVVGMEQKLPQLQLKLALYALGHGRLADKLVHFAYNLVRLPGYRMSSRRGRYFTLDEVMDEAISRAYEEVSKRSPHLSEKEKKRISEAVGIGAVKYALVEVDPNKPVVFTWDRVLDFEKNSAPYIQYSYARARSILRKAAREIGKPDCSLLKESLERDIILLLARFPEVFTGAVNTLKPNAISDFADALADKFNSFYNALPVIKAEPPELSDARLALVDATSIVFRNILRLLGIEALEKM